MGNWSTKAAPVALALGLALAYTIATTHHVSEDSIKYVRDALAGGSSLFHPHHLFYGVMAVVARAAGAGPEDVDGSLRAMQGANIFISVMAVLLFYRVCRQLGAATGGALALAGLFGLASAFFEFSSQVEVYNVTAAFMLLAALGLADRTESPGRRWLVAVGYFFAMGFHQVAVFLGVAIGIDAWGRGRGRARWTALLYSLALPLAAMGVCYVLVAVRLGHRTPDAFWRWLTAYAHLPFWGLGRPNAATLRELVVGTGKALADVTHLPKWILATAAGGLGAFAALHAPAWPAEPRRRFMLAMLAWLLAYGLFMAWWDAGNVESWIVATVPGFLLLAALSASPAAARLPVWRRRLAWGGLAACLAVVVATDVLAVRRDRVANLPQAAAQQLLPVARAGDLVLTVDTEKGAYFDLYLVGRGVTVEAIDLDLALEASRAGGPFTPAVVERLAERWRSASSRGARCFVDAWIVRGEISPTRYMLQIDAAQFRALFEQTFALQPLPGREPPLVYEIRGLQAPIAAR
jgi:hypothetical protein